MESVCVSYVHPGETSGRFMQSLVSLLIKDSMRKPVVYKGRTKPGTIVTHAPGCMSWHTWGRAVDLWLGTYELAPYAQLGEYWRSIGGVWGGSFNDNGHFEWHPGLTIEQACPPPYVCSYVPGSVLARHPGLIAAGIGIAVAGLGAGLAVWVASS